MESSAGKTLFTIPYQTLDIGKPEAGTFWRGNFGYRSGDAGKEAAAWPQPSGTRRIDDANSFGEITFLVR